MTAQYLAHSRALSRSKMSRDWAFLLVPRSISSHPHLLKLNKLNLEHLPHYLNRVSRSAVVIWHRRFTLLQHLAPTFKLDHADMVFRLVSPAPRRVLWPKQAPALLKERRTKRASACPRVNPPPATPPLHNLACVPTAWARADSASDAALLLPPTTPSTWTIVSTKKGVGFVSRILPRYLFCSALC